MSEEEYRLEVEIEDPEEIPEELGPGVPKTPYVSVLDEDGCEVAGEHTDEEGSASFELPEGDYRVNALSLTRRGYEKLYLGGNEKLSIETEFREELKKTFSQIL